MSRHCLQELTFRQPQEEPHSQKPSPTTRMLVINHTTLQRRHDSPNDTNQRQPKPWANFLQDQIPRHLQRDVTDEEQRQTVEVVRSISTQTEILLKAFQASVCDVCAIQE